MNNPKKFFLLFILSLTLIRAFSATPKNIRELFLSLPDSIFMKDNRAFDQDKDSFPLLERKRLIEIYDSAPNGFDEKIPRFYIRFLSDSLQEISFEDRADQAITLKILETKGKECFFSLSNYHGDEVMSFGRWFFYSLKGKKITEVKNVLPESYPLELFFDSTYLSEHHFDFVFSENDMLIYYDLENSGVLTGLLQTEILDPELMGEEDPKTKLDPEKIRTTVIHFKLVRRKFIILK
jgi:hypothetical protein